FHEALRLQPDFCFAYVELGELVKDGRYRFSPEEISHLRVLLERKNLIVEDVQGVQFTLAVALDRMGQTDEAFHHYRRSNELKQQIYTERRRAYSKEGQRQYVDRLIATYTPEFFRSVASFGSASEVPVFVVGVPRSGT